MKVQVKNQNGMVQDLAAASLVITLGNGETLEIGEESSGRPDHLSEGVTIWGGRIPEQGASLDALKESTRGLGIYPLAANMIHLFPLSK